MLLPRLKGEPQRRTPRLIHGYADQATGYRAAIRFAGSHKGSMRPTATERYTEPLRTSNHYIRAPFARRRQQGQGKQIRRHSDQSTRLLRRLDDAGVIFDTPIACRILQQQAVRISDF